MSIRIHGLTVCVNYSEYLCVSMPRWVEGLASLMVVTSPEDTKTRKTMELVGRHPVFPKSKVLLYVTDAFTRHGAAFNKGLAMEEARKVMPWEDWVLFFDIDVVPPPQWHLNLPELQLGYLYGAKRIQCPDLLHLFHSNLPLVPDDRVGYGYFQLFHTKSPSLYADHTPAIEMQPDRNGNIRMGPGLQERILKTPLLDTFWRHAGNYDSNFMLSFGSLVQDVGFPVWHIGPQHENWFGKGQKGQFEAMQATRAGLGIHESEKL